MNAGWPLCNAADSAPDGGGLTYQVHFSFGNVPEQPDVPSTSFARLSPPRYARSFCTAYVRHRLRPSMLGTNFRRASSEQHGEQSTCAHEFNGFVVLNEETQ